MSDFFTEQLLAVVVVVDLHRGAGRAALGGIPARLTRCTVGKQDDKSLSGALARLTVFLRTQPLRPLYCCPVCPGAAAQSVVSPANRPVRLTGLAAPAQQLGRCQHRPGPAQHNTQCIQFHGASRNSITSCKYVSLMMLIIRISPLDVQLKPLN